MNFSGTFSGTAPSRGRCRGLATASRVRRLSALLTSTSRLRLCVLKCATAVRLEAGEVAFRLSVVARRYVVRGKGVLDGVCSRGYDDAEVARVFSEQPVMRIVSNDIFGGRLGGMLEDVCCDLFLGALL